MKLISWRGCGKTDQALIFGDKIVEFGIADFGWGDQVGWGDPC
jgi:hypothetical protein